MNHERYAKPDFGDVPALVADRRRKPDRRQVSLRWLAGTLLTGITSTTMMGIALSAAYDGDRVFVSPALVDPVAALSEDLTEKGERVFATPIPIDRNRSTIEVSTMVREGGRDVIRSLPFAYASMLLGARHPTTQSYPTFDAMDVFAEEGETTEPANETPQIYGAKVEADVDVAMEPFAFEAAKLDDAPDIEAREAEALVRAASPRLDTRPVQVAAIEPVDPSRFGGQTMADFREYVPGSAVRVTQENVSLSPAEGATERAPRYFEEIVPFRETRSILEALGETDHVGVGPAAESLVAVLGRDTLDAGEVLRLGLAPDPAGSRIIRLSAYRGTQHLATVAVTDTERFAAGPEPALSHSVAEAFDENATEAPLRQNMPTVYDGIYQAALAYGLDDRLCQKLIRILAPDVDYQARLDPTDRLTLLYSMKEGADAPSADSQILFVEAKFGDTTRRYYRFHTTDDDQTDYYDEDGRSARQFLLRNPVPKGRFSSPFGSRRHPILGYSRMHWGVDWAAPRGTPILASGAGVVEHAGWTTGNGQQTVIKHANGYETSYSHQSQIAKGVVPGARVRQGQIIGYVGSTGLSTGNHLHYEVSVNGTRVDPLRIRLPNGRQLGGEVLDAFRIERQRIDKLLQDGIDEMRVAGR
ncbi:M23 family metallopeptidase [Aureimonas sp. AU4]|uniref:M23 family metallopeptidase n=1 Tax=Aureimonas sp. AU4 TaxID=1638163 RepID=UPI000706614E|nr:M23 family metallopeptidase [Aureimonas sp. AU4]BAT30480.1 membrane proteins related to metallo endopeptidases [Aureimonas sp. AU4]